MLAPTPWDFKWPLSIFSVLHSMPWAVSLSWTVRYHTSSSASGGAARKSKTTETSSPETSRPPGIINTSTALRRDRRLQWWLKNTLPHVQAYCQTNTWGTAGNPFPGRVRKSKMRRRRGSRAQIPNRRSQVCQEVVTLHEMRYLPIFLLMLMFFPAWFVSCMIYLSHSCFYWIVKNTPGKCHALKFLSFS